VSYDRNEILRKTAARLIPSGANTYSKSPNYYCAGAGPAVLARGQAGHVWDVDDNRFIDFVLGLGAVSIGYGHPEVTARIEHQLARGLAFSLVTELEIELAAKLVGIIPCAEMVRFVKNGTDATSAAVRLARAHTRRDHVALCGYHGWQDWSVGTTVNNRGVPAAVRELSHVFKYNDVESLEALFQRFPGQVAVVILEPANQIHPKPGFLQAVKKLTHREGAVLVFDEVVSGFRFSLGGAQQYFDVTPDLACFGKGMSNGASLSAVLGRADCMKEIDRGAFISMTHGGEGLSLASALATIELLEKPGSFEHIWGIGRSWVEGLRHHATAIGLESVIEFRGYDCHPGMLFQASPDGKLDASDLFAVFQQAMLDQGVLLLATNNFCLMHTQADVDEALAAAKTAFENVAAAIEKGTTEGLLRGEPYRPVFPRD